MGTKIVVLALLSGIAAVVTIGYLSYATAKASLLEEQYNKLTALRETKASQIEDYFHQIRDQIETFSDNLMIVDATKAFKESFHKTAEESNPAESNIKKIEIDLKHYYENIFFNKVDQSLKKETCLSCYIPKELNTKILQSIYIVSNPDKMKDKHKPKIVNADDYKRIHEKYHQKIKEYQSKFDYYDIFIVDHETGHIVYSVFKEVDFGTSLLTGPYKGTNLAKTFLAAGEALNKNFVKLTDFAPYFPSYNRPASFIASPVFDEHKKVGVVIFQMPISRINNIMTYKGDWSSVGLGKSGESYIVADDYTIRNQSRFLIEDKDVYLNTIKRTGVSQEIINMIKSTNSSVGLQLAKTKGTISALKGETGIDIFPDYRGIEVLSSYKPLNIGDVKWAIVSEIDKSEAYESIDSLRNQILLWVAILILLIGTAGTVFIVFSRRLIQQQQYIIETDRLASIGRISAGVAHEINTPLTCVYLTIQEIQSSIKDNELLKEIGEAGKNIEKAATIARELLQFSWKGEVEHIPVDINGIIKSAYTLFTHALKERDVSLQLSDIPFIMGDPLKLEEVVVNILQNSLDSVSRAGVIKIVTSCKEEWCKIEITDNGKGIAKTDLPKVFDPFFTTKEYGQGTGLGLSICYGIIKQHNGLIDIKSTSGKGTTVTVMLPVMH